MINDTNLLLEKIMAFEIAPDNDVFSFKARLCRENNWSDEYADLCINEYKRFIYLAAVSNQQITPSDAVDQVWHLHMLYTKSYWNELCLNILKSPLHHNPTKGGDIEKNRFIRQYQDTLKQYKYTFQETPPEDIWPEPQERFKDVDKFVRINAADITLVDKSKTTSLLVAIILFFILTIMKVESGILLFIQIAIGLYMFISVISFGSSKSSNKNKAEGNGCGGCG